MPLVPNALRLVSIVVALWTMTAFGSFQATYAGSGRGPAGAAGAAVCAVAESASAMPASTPALPARS
jgi:hypothetical protein